MPVILVFERSEQEDETFEVILGYIISLILRKLGIHSKPSQKEVKTV